MYQPTIGLEIHSQLKTKSKMFCLCPNESWKIGQEELAPNTTVCPICMGHPGTLPVINKKAIEWALKVALALNCTIPEKSKFDRKNYFYPDLPKGYQISQYDMPVGVNGYLNISNESLIKSNESRIFEKNSSSFKENSGKIRIRRVHLEEDAGKLIHPVKSLAYAREHGAGPSSTDYSLVDFNRAGVPLMELVTEPDIKGAKEAKEFCQELQLILRYLKVSDADMEKGQMRCEVNISLREIADKHGSSRLPITRNKRGNNNVALTFRSDFILPKGRSYRIFGSDKLGTKVEIKNLNSFKAVERAIECEIIRQSKLLGEGKKVIQETRGWDEVKQKTFPQRSKEEAEDYRYFPEPDLPPLRFQTAFRQGQEKFKTSPQGGKNFSNFIDIEKIKRELPELPQAKRKRFVEEYAFTPKDAKILTNSKELADYTEEVISELRAWLLSLDGIEGTEDEVWERYKKKLSKFVANWLINKLGGLLKTRGLTINQVNITPENFAEFITLIYQNKVSSKNALWLLEKMIETGGDPTDLLEEHGMGLIEDVSEIEPFVDQVIKENPEGVEEFKQGKTQLLKFFIGKVMRLSKGKANPKMIEDLLIQKLS